MQSVLRNRTFARLFAGRLVTNAGDSLYAVAAMWLAYDLGGSAFYTGLAGFLTMAPAALQFLAGPLVDRWDLRRILVGTQVVQALFVLVVPLAALLGWLSVWVVLVVMPLLALLNQLVYPAQTAALPRIVEDDELVEANSAFSFAYQGVDFAFTALGGILVAVFGATTLYLVDSVTFVAAALVFAGVAVPRAEGDDGERVAGVVEDYRGKLAEGIGYVRGSVLAQVLVASLVVNFAVGATLAVLPSYAEHYGGPEVYGFLLAAVTCGLLVGSLVATPMKRFPLSSLSVVGFAVSGVTWLAAVAAESLALTVSLFCLAWIPVGVTNVIVMAFVQSVVPETLLGRVTSVVTSASTAATPVGMLLGGLAGDAVGSGLVVTSAGVGFCFLAVYWLVHPVLRDMTAVEDIDAERYGLARMDAA